MKKASSSCSSRSRTFPAVAALSSHPLGDDSLEDKKPTSEDIPSEVRTAVLDAAESLGSRVTVGDVAARSGVSLPQTERALQAIAMDAGGTLEVTETGELTYVLPRDVGARLAAKSARIRLEPVIQKTQKVMSYVVRVSFGTALLASIALVYTALYLVMNSSNREERSSSRSSFGGGYGGFYMYPTDFLWYWDPYHYERRRMAQLYGEPEPMNFFEAVFSFVFGDGDPNQFSEQSRWELVGRMIRARGGVVTAEQLAPYLNLIGDARSSGRSPLVLEPASGGTVETTVMDEGFVLEVLQRFDGTPEVDDDGNIFYSFPALRTTAGGGAFSSDLQNTPRAFVMRNWKFSEAQPGQLMMAGLLGAANLVGVVLLGGVLSNPTTMAKIMYAYGKNSGPATIISTAAFLYPALIAYAVAFFAVPFLRMMWNARRNAQLDAENEARLEAAAAIANAGPATSSKLQRAEQRSRSAGMDVLSRDRVIFSSEQSSSEWSNN